MKKKLYIYIYVCLYVLGLPLMTNFISINLSTNFSINLND